MSTKRKDSLILATLTLVLLIFFGGVFFSFNHNLNLRIQQNIIAHLHEATGPYKTSFEGLMREQQQKVHRLASLLGESKTLHSAENLLLLRSTEQYDGLLQCAILLPDGSYLAADGPGEGSVKGMDFFEAGMQGKAFISSPFPATGDPDTLAIVFASPIVQQGKVTGVASYAYPCEKLEAMLDLSLMDGQGQVLVIKETGEVLLGGGENLPTGANFVQILQDRCTHEHHPNSPCFSLSGHEGNFSLTPKEEPGARLLTWQKLGYNDWYLVSSVPEKMTSIAITDVARDQNVLMMMIGCGVLIYLAVVLGLLCQRHIDPMTGALTLDGFKRKTKKILRRRGAANYVLIKLDVKNLKLINRLHSFDMGDRVIKNIAESLRATMADKDTLIARVGTDDFLMLLPFFGRTRLNQQRNQFNSLFHQLMGPKFTTTVEFPCGQYVLTPRDYPHPDVAEILEKVNFAHRAAKQHTEYNNVVDYVENIEKDALMQKSVEDRMAGALKGGQFQLYLQPKYRVRDEAICGAEALTRWRVDGQNFINPASFIPILESNGFIVKLDMYIFNQTVLYLRGRIDIHEVPIPISVNFSRFHLMNDQFVAELCAITDAHCVPRKYLEIELTESAVFENVERMATLIDKLHRAGFTMSMDDFGSGYSCLALLKDLQVDVLKIDRGFFTEGPNTSVSRGRLVVTNVLRMAQDLGIVTVAEGIDKSEQVDMLRELGCDIIQGYYYAKPMPADELSAHMTSSAENPE